MCPYNWKFGDFCRRIERAEPAFQVCFKFAAPLVDDGHGRDGRGVAQWAKGAPQHVLGQVFDVVDVLAQPPAVVEAGKRLLEPVSAFAAGNAPAAALVLIELHDAQREFDHAGLVVDDDNATRAQELAALAEGVKIHVHLVCFFSRENEGGRSAGNHGFQFASVGNAATHVVDHFFKRITQRQFVNAGLVDMSAQAEEARAAVLRRAVIGKLLPARQNNVGDRSNGFDVVDDRRPAPESDHGREGRTDAGNAALALERFHQRRLFAHFVRAGAGVPIAVKLLTAAEDVIPQEDFGIGISERFSHDVDQVAVFAANIDEAELGADGEAGDDHALDHGVRIVFQDGSVFAGAGLTLVAVDQDVFGLGRFLGYEGPLHAGGEAGAAAPAKVRRFDLIDDVVGRHAEGFLRGFVAIELEVSLDIGRALAKALGDDFYFIGMGSEVCHLESIASPCSCTDPRPYRPCRWSNSREN